MDSQPLHLKEFAENTPVVFYQYRLHPDGRHGFPYVNQAIEHVLGLGPEAVMADPETWFGAIHPDDLPSLRASIAESARTLSTWQWEGRARAVDGAFRWFRGQSRPVRLDDGSLLWSGAFMDITDLKEMEAELRKANENLQQSSDLALKKQRDFTNSLFDAAGSLIAALDCKGHIVRFNQAAEQITGWRFDEIKDRPFWETFLLPEEHNAVMRMFANLTAGVVTPRYVNHWLMRDGSRRLFDWSNAVLLDERGKVDYIVTIGTDITEQRRNQEARQRAEKMLHLVLDTIPARVFWKDRDSTYLGCNKLFAQDAGLASPAEIVGKTDFDLPWKAEAELYRADDRHVIDHNEARLEYEEPQTLPSGEVHWLEISKVPLTDADGDVIGVMGTYNDITPRKLAETALKESEQRFRDIAHSSGDFVWEIDANGVYTFASGAIEAILGHRPEEIFGKTPFDLMPPDEAERVTRVFASIAAERRPIVDLENWNIRKDGRQVCLLTRGVPVLDSEGRLLGYRGMDKDITERKQTEAVLIQAKEAAEHASQAKSLFLSSMSHELRTPLNAILGFAQLLELDPDLRPDQQDGVQEILHAGQHLLALINDVLDLAKIEAGKLDVCVETVDLGTLIEEGCRLIAPTTEPTGIAVHADTASCQGRQVQADRTRLKQVLLNLLSNAVKYNRPNGSVDIYCQDAGTGRLRLAIRDTGMGIAQDKLAELFLPFRRLGREGGNIQGTGIGLVISKNLLELMQGQLSVESRDGVGSTFWIELPTVDAH